MKLTDNRWRVIANVYLLGGLWSWGKKQSDNPRYGSFNDNTWRNAGIRTCIGVR